MFKCGPTPHTGMTTLGHPWSTNHLIRRLLRHADVSVFRVVEGTCFALKHAHTPFVVHQD